jgi:hypothetical protein
MGYGLCFCSQTAGRVYGWPRSGSFSNLLSASARARPGRRRRRPAGCDVHRLRGRGHVPHGANTEPAMTHTPWSCCWRASRSRRSPPVSRIWSEGEWRRAVDRRQRGRAPARCRARVRLRARRRAGGGQARERSAPQASVRSRRRRRTTGGRLRCDRLGEPWACRAGARRTAQAQGPDSFWEPAPADSWRGSR